MQREHALLKSKIQAYKAYEHKKFSGMFWLGGGREREREREREKKQR